MGLLCLRRTGERISMWEERVRKWVPAGPAPPTSLLVCFPKRLSGFSLCALALEHAGQKCRETRSVAFFLTCNQSKSTFRPVSLRSRFWHKPQFTRIGLEFGARRETHLSSVCSRYSSFHRSPNPSNPSPDKAARASVMRGTESSTKSATVGGGGSSSPCEVAPASSRWQTKPCVHPCDLALWSK